MRLGRGALVACALLLPALWLSARIPAPTGGAWIELTDAGSGRRIASRLLAPREQVVLTWTNSLFRLPVREVLVAAGGILRLTEVTFADPSGREPPHVRAADVGDLYHTGGPFKAEGLWRPISRVVFRVGEIGAPVIRVGDRRISLVREVGFGGAVLLVARRPTLSEWSLGR